MKDTVYYLPGMGGRLETGLGEGIIQRGYNVVGQATLGAFKKLRFQEKIDIITTDLMESFWSDSSIVVANSFGAYLFLHSQINMPPFPGKVILFSPVIGTATNSEIAVRFYLNQTRFTGEHKAWKVWYDQRQTGREGLVQHDVTISSGERSLLWKY